MTQIVQLSLLYREIPLSGKRGAGKSALVDAADHPYLSQFVWYHQPSPTPGHEGYVTRRVPQSVKRIFMHNDIMQPPPAMEVDHIRIGSGLDNRRANLRLVPHWLNLHNRGLDKNNRSGHKGVSWDERRKAWRARIHVCGKERHLGTFQSYDAACAAYDEARDIFGITPMDATQAMPDRPFHLSRNRRRTNTSGQPGVHWRHDWQAWIARITIGGKRHHLGHFATVEEAAAAYQAARVKHALG